MSLERSDTTDPYAHGSAERPTLEEGSKLNISPVQSTQIGPQDAHWLRMDPSLTRAVLAKTEEELLGGLAALMRNKVEHEQVSRRLAQVQIDAAQAKAVFLAVLEMDGPQRAAYLDTACAADPVLRQRVEAMLHANEVSGELLERPPEEMLTDDGAELR